MAAIGIGENGHIAFNDPPADFETQESYESYIVVNLDDKCKGQQVGEGWFEDITKVPCQAISMTISQIMKFRVIVSVVPHKVKAKAVADTLAQPVNPLAPATVLKTHPCWYLFLDRESEAGFLQL